MASLQKALNDLSGADEKAAQQKERLELLKNAAQAHLKIAEDSIAQDLAGNGGGLHKLFIVPDTVMDFQQGYTVTSGETMDAGLTSAIDQFFSGDTKDGFKSVVQSALSTLFADTTTGESTRNYYFVAMEHGAFVRVDVSVWKYYFSQKSIQDDMQQAFCYTFCKSIIDHKKISVDSLIYLVHMYAGDDENKVQGFLDSMKALYAELDDKTPQAVASNALAMFRR